MLGAADAELLFDAVDAVIAEDPKAVLLGVEKMARSGRDPSQFARDLLAHLRHLLVTQTTGEVPDTFVVTATDAGRMQAQASAIGAATLVRTIDELAEALTAVREGDDARHGGRDRAARKRRGRTWTPRPRVCCGGSSGLETADGGGGPRVLSEDQGGAAGESCPRPPDPPPPAAAPPRRTFPTPDPLRDEPSRRARTGRRRRGRAVAAERPSRRSAEPAGTRATGLRRPLSLDEVVADLARRHREAAGDEPGAGRDLRGRAAGGFERGGAARSAFPPS